MPKKEIPQRAKVEVIPEFAPMRIKYKDIFHFKDFYKALKEWLLEHDWKDLEEGKDRWETYYGERIGQSGAKEIWIRWRPFKDVPDAKFLTYYLDFDFHLLNFLPTEIISDGKKFKANKGEVDLYIRAYIEKKFVSVFGKSNLLKHFLTLFQERIYGGTIEDRKKELYQETYILNNFIKQWFKMKRYLPYEEVQNFPKSYAWPSHLKK